MSDMISIIIPVYNSGAFLMQCLDSVKKQSYRELQIIIVYTDSKDDSFEICKRYVEEDSRFEMVMNKENILGASYARNLGLMHVKGKYLGFVDSDDIIAENMYEILHYSIKRHDADIAICRYTKKEEISCGSYVEGRVLSRQETQYEFLAGKLFYGQLWNKLFRLEKIKKLKFDSNLQVAEDVQYVWQAVCLSLKNVYIPTLLYFYRCNEDGITHKFKEKHYRDTMHVLNDIENTIDDTNPRIKNAAGFRKKIVYAQNFISMKQSGVKNVGLEDELRNRMKEKRFRIRGCRAFSSTAKMMGILMGINPDVGYALYSIYLSRKKQSAGV